MQSVQRIGAAIRSAREANGLTLTELAEHAGTTRQSIAKIEDGHPRGEIALVAQLAHTLGLELTIHDRGEHVNLISKIRSRTDKTSRQSVLARGIYGPRLAPQTPTDILQNRAHHLLQQWQHAAQQGDSFALTYLRNPVFRILTNSDHTSPELLNLCAYPMPYLYVRQAIEHPAWIPNELNRRKNNDTRRNLARIVAIHGTQPAPDHQGRLISFNKRPPKPAADWETESTNALAALTPALAQQIANALTRELWGQWIVQDLQLHAFPHENGDGTTQYFVTNLANRPRGRYHSERAFAAAADWPESEAALLIDTTWARNVRRELFTHIGNLSHADDSAWAKTMYQLVGSLDTLTLNALAQILAPEAGAVEADREYDHALATLTEGGDTPQRAIRNAVIDTARRARLKVIPQNQS